VSETLEGVRRAVATANRILANEGVLDAFGHVSARHPEDSSRYLLSRSRAPELVQPADILEFTLDSEPVVAPTARLYAERVIHGEIYKARPDVQAVVHHHAPAVMPFCITGATMVPVFHLGATMGATVPFWDSRDEFGDTSLLVIEPGEGRSLAAALGSHAMVLMRGHGATVVGGNVQELVFRTIYSCRNAEFQLRAMALGALMPLSPGEIERASAINLRPGVTARAWEVWAARLDKAERAGAAAPAAVTPPARRKAAGLPRGRSTRGGRKPTTKTRGRKR
jgi:ribulose-5-phosphate 4-epimerase/fuculose-1-phosphate aldolase